MTLEKKSYALFTPWRKAATAAVFSLLAIPAEPPDTTKTGIRKTNTATTRASIR